MKRGTRTSQGSLEPTVLAPPPPLLSGLTLNKHTNFSLAPLPQQNEEENGRNGDKNLCI